MKAFLITAIFLTCSLCPSAQAQTDDATKEDVQQFLTLMNVRQQMNVMATGVFQQLVKSMIEEYKRSHPNATADEIARVQQSASNVTQVAIQNFPLNEMIDAMIPIYQHHLTHSDIQTAIAFYSSQTGQKFIREAPTMMNEGMQAGSAVMQKHLPELKAQMEEAARQAAKPDEAAPK